MQATRTFPDAVKDTIRREPDRTASNDPILLWWDDGNYLQNAVEAAPDDVARLGVPHDAATLYTVLENHEPDHDWEQAIHRRVTSPSSLVAKLSDHADHSELTVDTETRPTQYKLAATNTSATALPVEAIEDLSSCRAWPTWNNASTRGTKL